jgi:acyl-CoA thioester hydrolase
MVWEEDFRVSWAHLDGNAHMANTSFMQLAIDCRFHYFASRGFSPADFASWGVGPVVRRDEVEYYRELRLLETGRVNLMLAGLSADASRFRIANEIRHSGGDLVARVTSLGGWLDLAGRKLVVPPAPLADALRALERTPDYEPLPSSIR